MASVQAYYRLTKPGIVYGNALSAIGGFFLASQAHLDGRLFAAMLVGICFVIASGCVVNNYIDRGIDAKMKRTKKRSLVTGEISARAALLYATALGIIGIVSLLQTNLLTVGVALFGWFFYVAVYGYWKRRSSLGTVVGSISGAVPLVVGYVAVTNQLDIGALLLFVILALWQMPHFYAISIYRSPEYSAAHIPVLPLVRGKKTTKVYIMIYIVAFIIASAALTAVGVTGVTYLFIMMIVGAVWLWRGLKGFRAQDDDQWARSMFGFSLIVLITFCASISLSPWLP